MLADFTNPDHFKISNEKAHSLHIVEGYEGVDHEIISHIEEFNLTSEVRSV
jgi:hypothetical protein